MPGGSRSGCGRVISRRRSSIGGPSDSSGFLVWALGVSTDSRTNAARDSRARSSTVCRKASSERSAAPDRRRSHQPSCSISARLGQTLLGPGMRLLKGGLAGLRADRGECVSSQSRAALSRGVRARRRAASWRRFPRSPARAPRARARSRRGRGASPSAHESRPRSPIRGARPSSRARMNARSNVAPCAAWPVSA
jgi:hypothetical protein